MHILLVGGGKVGFYLIKTLLEKGHEVAVIEQQERLCTNLAEQFDILVINGDGTNLHYLADAGADQADVVAAVTGQDEVNLVVCQIAKRNFQVPRVIARVNNPKNERVLTKLGVDAAISSTSAIANLIESQLDLEAIRTVLTLGKGDMLFVQFVLDEKSNGVNKSIQELARDLPEDCVLVAIQRNGNLLIPRGGTILQEGDEVIALTSVNSQQQLKKVLYAKNSFMKWIGKHE